MTPEHRDRIDAILRRAPVLPVLAVDRLEQAVALARCLVDAGLPVLEVTLRTPVALDAIRAIRAAVPDAIVGAGTVLDAAQLEAVEAAGVSFAISPGASAALYEDARNSAIPLLPGIATASELMDGMTRGWRHFKFFPAAAMGGVATLKAFAGPFPEARFCPTGGIHPGNAADYLAQPNVLTVGGSWMVPGELLAASDWPAVAALAHVAARLGR